MQFSYWEKDTFIKTPDVAIIGSGIVGLNSALSLKNKFPQLHIVVLERGMLPYGASTRNAGFACYGSPSELLEDLKNNSEDDVFNLVEKRWKGLLRLRKILGDVSIKYEEYGGHEVFGMQDEPLFEQCMNSIQELNRHLHEITGEKEMYFLADRLIDEFGFKNVGHIIKNKGEGQIDTGLMMKALLSKATEAGVEVLNGALVDELRETDDGVEINIADTIQKKNETEKITARKCLICINGFAKKFLPEFDVQPARAQVLITAPIKNLKVKGSFHYDRGYYYFRNVEDRLLFGGGRNLDFEREHTEEFGLTQDVQSRLDHLMRTMILPGQEYKTEMRWSGIMGLGSTKSPIIRKTGKNIYCAVRMGGMGIAIGSLVGEEAAEMVMNDL